MYDNENSANPYLKLVIAFTLYDKLIRYLILIVWTRIPRRTFLQSNLFNISYSVALSIKTPTRPACVFERPQLTRESDLHTIKALHATEGPNYSIKVIHCTSINSVDIICYTRAIEHVHWAAQALEVETSSRMGSGDFGPSKLRRDYEFWEYINPELILNKIWIWRYNPKQIPRKPKLPGDDVTELQWSRYTVLSQYFQDWSAWA